MKKDFNGLNEAMFAKADELDRELLSNSARHPWIDRMGLLKGCILRGAPKAGVMPFVRFHIEFNGKYYMTELAPNVVNKAGPNGTEVDWNQFYLFDHRTLGRLKDENGEDIMVTGPTPKYQPSKISLFFHWVDPETGLRYEIPQRDFYQWDAQRHRSVGVTASVLSRFEKWASLMFPMLSEIVKGVKPEDDVCAARDIILLPHLQFQFIGQSFDVLVGVKSDDDETDKTNEELASDPDAKFRMILVGLPGSLERYKDYGKSSKTSDNERQNRLLNSRSKKGSPKTRGKS